MTTTPPWVPAPPAIAGAEVDPSDRPAAEHAAAQGREPVRDAGRVTGLLQALITALGGIPATIVIALNTPDGWQALAASLGTASTAAIALACYLIATRSAARVRAQVTPLLDPRDLAGRRLVSAAQPNPYELELTSAMEGLIDQVGQLLGQAGGDHSAVTVHLTGRQQDPDELATRILRQAHLTEGLAQ